MEGHSAYVYCGSAKATVRFGGKTYRFANGECSSTAGQDVIVNIGTQLEGGRTSPKTSYFGIEVLGRRSGVTEGAILGFNVGSFTPGRLFHGKADLESGLRSGTFSAEDVKRRAVNGSFSC